MLLASLALCLAQTADPLKELLQMTASTPFFSARYDLTTTTSTEPSVIEIDYIAPDRLRFSRASRARSTTMWAVGGVLSVRSTEGGTPLHGSVDCSGVHAELAPVETLLRAAIPAVEPRGELKPALSFRWNFDEAAQKANFGIEAALAEDITTPMGWVDTLREKAAAPRADGGLLRFSTDGHFELALDASNGMLREFKGRSPKGEMTLALRAARMDYAPPVGLFTVSPPVDGAKDVSLELRRTAARSLEVGMRRRIFRAFAADKGPLVGTGDELAAAQQSARGVLRALHVLTLAPVVETMLPRAGAMNEGVVKRLVQLRDSGKAAEELAAARARETELLRANLGKLESQMLEGSALPPGCENLPHGAAMLSLESEVLKALFTERVVDPLVRSFEAACDAKLR